MIKIFFTYIKNSPFYKWEQKYISGIPKTLAELLLLSRANNPFEPVTDPGKADIIIIWESMLQKTRKYIEILKQEPLINNYPNKVFVINNEDYPSGFLPGLYTSITTKLFDPIRHRAWGYIFPVNDEINVVPENAELPQYLFSFRGFLSHQVRIKIASMYCRPSPDYKIAVVNKWYNHSRDDKKEYTRDILNSYFSLCPRGLGTASYRLFETMALGRRPVIISDEWIPIANVDWNTCSIIIKEKDVPNIYAILKEKASLAVSLGKNARDVWKQYFSPANVVWWSVNLINTLKQGTSPDSNWGQYQNRWQTKLFFELNGWTIQQKSTFFIKAMKNKLMRLILTVKTICVKLNRG